MFTVLNDPKTDKGSYLFSGQSIISNAVSLQFSDIEIDQILKEVKKYTSTPRDYLIVLENQNKEKIYVTDNISSIDIESLQEEGCKEEKIKAMNYFTVLSEGELPIT